MAKYTKPVVKSTKSRIPEYIKLFKDEFARRLKDKAFSTWDKLSLIFALILEMIASLLLKQKITEEERTFLVEAIVDLWLTYCNIKIIPDDWEAWFIRRAAKALIDAAIGYFSGLSAKKPSIFLKIA